MIVLYIILGIVGAAVLWIIIDVLIALTKKPIPDIPANFLDPSGLSLVYHFLTEPDKVPDGVKVDEAFILNALEPSIKYINGRYDCADFRLQLLFRTYKDCADKLPESVKALIKKTCLDFKYWVDEPGADSMCTWSENHQLLFAVSEYLHGQEWPKEVFTNTGLSGAEHMDKAIKRINAWMELRFTYGFSEWLSNNYYAEDIAPMSNYIQYSHHKDSVQRMKIIMDLLWLDVATHSVNNTFVGASSRMYGDNKSSDIYGNRIRAGMQAVWSKVDTSSLVQARSALEKSIAEGAADMETTVKLVGVDAQIMQNFIAMYKAGFYKVPEVIYDIALDKSEQVIKCSEGINVKEMADDGLIGQDVKQIMAQLGSEAFTNPEVIENTLRFLGRSRMYRNLFVTYFKFLNIKLFRLLGIPKLLAKKLDLMTHGIALQRGNLYCYRTSRYTLTTAMAQNVDVCGAQAHIWTANIAPDLTLYTTHPARDDDSRDKHGASPGYWVGNGRQPMSVQDKNINITIYKLPEKKRPAEFHISEVTHAYVPREKYDKLEFQGNYVFGQRGDVLIALIASGQPEYRPFDSYASSLLIQHDRLVEKIDEINLGKEFDLVLKGGIYHSYVTEISDTEKESFQDFVKRIKLNKLDIMNGSVVYCSGGRELIVSYGGSFMVNGEAQSLDYPRYESVYVKAERKPQDINVSFNGKSLKLNYKRMERIENA